MKNKITITESTKNSFNEEFSENFDDLTEEEIIEKAKSSKNFNVKIKENGEVLIRQTLHG